jgi:hypothetical protein
MSGLGVWDRPIDRTRISIAAIVGLIPFRFFAGGVLPIYYHDEIYYWLWSRHLAAGYYDHPPAIAFVIRAGTAPRLFVNNSALPLSLGYVPLGRIAVSNIPFAPLSRAVRRTNPDFQKQ